MSKRSEHDGPDRSDLEQDEDGFVEAKQLEVAGQLIDEFTGHTWAVPADNVEDLGDFNPSNPLDFPREYRDPRFYYQWINKAEWPSYKGLKFVRVTCREMHLDSDESPQALALAAEYGKPVQTEFIEYVDAMYVKCPLHIKAALDKRNEEARALALQGTEPRRQLHETAGGGRVLIQDIHRRTVETMEE